MITQSDLKYFKDFCKDKRQLSDTKIALLLIKDKYKKYNNLTGVNVIRRNISFVRAFFNMREKFPPKEKLIESYLKLQKKYPDASINSLASKLKLQYPKYSVKTLVKYISNYNNYGHII